MSDSLKISDNIHVASSKPRKESLQICGEVTLTVGGKTYKSRNAISSALKVRLAEGMVFSESHNIRDAELFDEANVIPSQESYIMQRGEIEVISTDFGATEPARSITSFIVFEVTTMGTVTIDTDDPFNGVSSFQFEVTEQMTVTQVRDAILNAFEFAPIAGYYELVNVQTNEYDQVGFYMQALADGSSFDGAELTSSYDGLLFTGPTTGGQTGDTTRNFVLELTPEGEPTESWAFQVDAGETPEQLIIRMYNEIEVYLLGLAYFRERMGRFIFIEGFSEESSPILTISVSGDVGPGDIDIRTQDFKPIGANQNEKDGICYRLEGGGLFTMETTRIDAVNPYGARWKGEAVFLESEESPSPSPSPSPDDPPKLLGLRLGRSYQNPPPGVPSSFAFPFLHSFAIRDQGIQGGEGIPFPVSIAPGTPFSVEWEIFIIMP